MRRTCPLVALALLLGAAPASADWVVFRDGRALRVSRWSFEGSETAVDLPGGGAMRFSSEVVKYVAPDEDVERDEATPAPAADGGWTAFSHPTYVEPIRRLASKHALEPALVAAVIKVESDFRPHAVSPKGAKGLMQLMPATARDRGLADPFDAEANIDAGAGYLRHLLERYSGDLRLALAAYNAGPGAVDRARGIPDYRETRDYVARVLRVSGLEPR